ncbi:MAG: hypothetical protein ACKVVT_13120 [Dehalococcoidia bacterium]
MSMDDDAAKTLGKPVLATAVVSPKGQGRRIMAAGALRQAAGLAGAMVGEKLAKPRGNTPGGFTGGYMVMALTADDLAFFQMKRGLLKNGAGELLETVPRAEVEAMEFGGGKLTTELTVQLTDGTSWALEVPRANKGGAEKIVKLFTPPAS